MRIPRPVTPRGHVRKSRSWDHLALEEALFDFFFARDSQVDLSTIPPNSTAAPSGLEFSINRHGMKGR